MESILQTTKHTLVYVPAQFVGRPEAVEAAYVAANFCGKVVSEWPHDAVGPVYAIGNIKVNVPGDAVATIVTDLSYNYDESTNSHITSGQVPLNIHGQGVYFRQLFGDWAEFYDKLTTAHEFQILTESNKPSVSFRKGIYLTPVEEATDGSRTFNLLRCSTNLGGPTEDFAVPDHEIVDKVAATAADFFDGGATLNHVLAQVYENVVVEGAEKKATIKAHSDKTKDMPRNGLMAFTTFYKFNPSVKLHNPPSDPFDLHYGGSSALTRLQFRLKSGLAETGLAKEFSITLYPGSVFIMSLSANRFYTHEIKASCLPIDKIPTRMGYVIRCSKTQAVHKDGQTYIKTAEGTLEPLQRITAEDQKHIKDLYYVENTTADFVDYGTVLCSMNQGDYVMPVRK